MLYKKKSIILIQLKISPSFGRPNIYPKFTQCSLQPPRTRVLFASTQMAGQAAQLDSMRPLSVATDTTAVRLFHVPDQNLLSKQTLRQRCRMAQRHRSSKWRNDIKFHFCPENRLFPWLAGKPAQEVIPSYTSAQVDQHLPKQRTAGTLHGQSYVFVSLQTRLF